MPTAPRQSSAERIATSLAWLERYRPLIADWGAFRAALDTPPPVDLLVPPGRGSVAAVRTTLAARGLTTTTFDWTAHHLRVHDWRGAGALPEVVFGFSHPQGVASALPPLLLAPAPGETVLDLCAAPGGKSVLLATLAEDCARVIAADSSVGRAGLLVQTLARNAVTSVMTVAQDGCGFPAIRRFDAVLVDAPCTGEGTFRVPVPRYDPVGESGLARSSTLQRRLLIRALDLLAPGGRLVYSTCSYAPEENEIVLDAVLGARDDARIAALPAGLPGQPAVTEWNGVRLRPDLAHARRLFPHHTGSWGFFAALVVKDPASTRIAREKPADPGAGQLVEDPTARDAAVRYFGERFGVPPDAFAAHALVARGRDVWTLLADSLLPPSRLRIVAPGVRLLHRPSQGLRPATPGMRWLGPLITRRSMDLQFDAAAELLRSGTAPTPVGTLEGLHALRVDGRVVAIVNVRGAMAHLELPSGWR